MKKQAKYFGLHLLKTTNTPLSKDNWFLTILKIGNKTYYTAEGTVGRKAMEDKSYFDNLLSTGQQINPDLGDNILNCTIKAQFLKDSINTGESQGNGNEDNEDSEESNNYHNDDHSIPGPSRARTLSQFVNSRGVMQAINKHKSQAKQKII